MGLVDKVKNMDHSARHVSPKIQRTNEEAHAKRLAAAIPPLISDPYPLFALHT